MGHLEADGSMKTATVQERVTWSDRHHDVKAGPIVRRIITHIVYTPDIDKGGVGHTLEQVTASKNTCKTRICCPLMMK